MLNRINLLMQGRVAVFKNFFALGILQGTNFLIPLIIMPYLVSTIGVDGYGIVNFINAIMIYFASFTDYGFTVSATRDIAINRKDTEKISEIFGVVITTKLILLLVSAIILFSMVMLIPIFQKYEEAYFLGFFIVIGQTALPVWFFQGMEKMKYITYLNLTSKVLFTILIFVFVKEKSDFTLVLLFYGLGNLASGIIGIFLAIKEFNLSLKKPTTSKILKELQTGWRLFLANFSIVSYINSNVFILGLFTSNLVVGYYSVAEKIIMAMRQILVVFSQATYPHICQLVEQSREKVISFYKQIFIPFSFLYLLLSIGVFVFAEPIVMLLTKSSDLEIIRILKILCFVPFVVALNIPAYQTLLANHFQKSCTNVLIIGSILNIGLNLFLAKELGALGTAFSVILTEVFITIGLHFILQNRHSESGFFSTSKI